MEETQVKRNESWALKATLGSRYCSRNGKANISPALSLVLPTDIPAGALASQEPSAVAHTQG